MTSVMLLNKYEDKVEFTSLFGEGVAVWCGGPPQMDESYHVEFEVNDIFEWGVNIEGVNESVPAIKVIGDNVLFVAEVLSYENDGVLTVSLGGEVIFLDVGFLLGEERYVSFCTKINNVFLYPVSL